MDMDPVPFNFDCSFVGLSTGIKLDSTVFLFIGILSKA